MSLVHVTAAVGRPPLAAWKRDAGIGLLLALGALVLYATQGFATLTDARGDNDSLMRLVQVRDLLGGQGWFDLTQYRMGPEGGFVMHWSRLVDAPIAGLILIGTALGAGNAQAETAAAVIWPLFLFGAAIFFILRSVRFLADEWALLPAAVVGAAALYPVGHFAPGALDHHNVQLVLALATLSFLLQPTDRLRAGLGAGACAALMLAIAMEAAPYVAVAGAAAAGGFLFHGGAERERAAGFGVAFAGIALAALAATVPPGGWLAVRCDAYSFAQFAAAALAGAGLAAVALVPAANAGMARRAGALALLAAALGVAALVLFPQCLGDPYAGLDPRIRKYWLDSVREAQSALSLMGASPGKAAGFYATPLLALGVLAVALRRRGPGRETLTAGAFLATAVLVSVWQVRGAMFSLPLAVPVLAAWVGEVRAAASAHRTRMSSMKVVAAWLLSVCVVWSVTANALVGQIAGSKPVDPAGENADDCYRAADYGELAALPVGTVLAGSNLGAPILRHTPHRVLTGPYHRNVDGIILALDAFMGAPAAAGQTVDDHGVDYVALCPDNPETGMLARWAPEGLMARLEAGEAPAWLRPLPATADDPLRLYRVVPAR